MLYVGVDFHKNYSFITEMDKDGEVKYRQKIDNDRTILKGYLSKLPSDTKIALEATCNWYYFYELTEEYGLDISLAHPLKTKAIASARLMNDKISSTTLAHLLRANLLPKAYIPDQETRDIREILRTHAFLISMRSRIKNRIHAVLLKNGIKCPYSDILGKGSLKWLNALNLRFCYQEAIKGYIRLAEAFNTEIKLFEQTIESLAIENKNARLLDTHPGISYYSGLLIASEIGDVSRFSNHGKLCSYAGLVPTMHASGGKIRRGHITKEGSKWLRWILVECSAHAVKKSSRYYSLYHRVAYKHGKGTARIAVARNMLRVMYYMLKYNKSYEERSGSKRTPVSASGS